MMSLFSPLVAVMMMFSVGVANENTMEHEPEILATSTQKEIIVKTVNKYGLDVSLEKKIKETFGKDGETMVAVAIAESVMYQGNAINYNCEYTRADGTKYSTSCKREDRHLAWSVDCGLLQINQRGQKCDEEMFDNEKNIARGKEIYDSQGLGAWSAWKNGSFEKYLDYATKYSVVE